MEKLSIKQAAKYLNYSESSIRSAIYNKKTLKYEKIGKNIFITKENLDEYKKIQKSTIFKRYDKDIVTKWLELYKIGFTFSKIAKDYQCDQNTVSKQLKSKFPDFNFDPYNFKLTEEERLIYKQAKILYYSDNNISLEEISRKFPIITTSKFRSYLKRIGEDIKSTGIVRSKCANHNFFENIDSEIKAYLLGFFAADGHLEFKEDSYCLKVGVSIKDAHIVLLFNKYICENKASILICNNNTATINIGSKILGESLIKHHFDNNKTYSFNKLPNIQEEYMRHFIRGFFDGDGSITVNRRTSNKRLNGYNRIFSISCVNTDLLNEIGNILPINSFSIEETTKPGRKTIIKERETISTTSCYQLKVSDCSNLKQIYDYFYKDANFFFKRKKDNFYLSFQDSNIIDGLLQGNL